MAEGKWIVGLAPTLTVDDAARLVLAARFETVRHFGPLATERPEENIEYVHQLRVGTRRAAAALRVFRDILKPKRRDKVKRQLRAIRQSAGEARDWDVFRQAIITRQRATAPQDAAAFDFLLGYALSERVAAQAHLMRQAAKSPLDITALLDAIRTPKSTAEATTFGDLAAIQLEALLGAFHVRVLANPATPAELHQLRILGKRLRYAIELFVSCFDPALKDVFYPAVEQVQEILGQLQDAAVRATRLEALRERVRQMMPEEWPRLEAGIDAWLADLRHQWPATREQFQTWRENWLALMAAHPFESLHVPAVSS